MRVYNDAILDYLIFQEFITNGTFAFHLKIDLKEIQIFLSRSRIMQHVSVIMSTT